MQWNSTPNAGFSPPETPRLWLPLATDYRKINVEHQLAKPTSILNLYRRLLAFRSATPALQRGSYQPLDSVPETCYAFLRQADGRRLLITLNFSDQEQRVALPALGDGTILISTHLDREERVNLAKFVLRGNEGVIIELSAQDCRRSS